MASSKQKDLKAQAKTFMHAIQGLEKNKGISAAEKKPLQTSDCNQQGLSLDSHIHYAVEKSSFSFEDKSGEKKSSKTEANELSSVSDLNSYHKVQESFSTIKSRSKKRDLTIKVLKHSGDVHYDQDTDLGVSSNANFNSKVDESYTSAEKKISEKSPSSSFEDHVYVCDTQKPNYGFISELKSQDLTLRSSEKYTADVGDDKEKNCNRTLDTYLPSKVQDPICSENKADKISLYSYSKECDLDVNQRQDNLLFETNSPKLGTASNVENQSPSRFSPIDSGNKFNSLGGGDGPLRKSHDVSTGKSPMMSARLWSKEQSINVGTTERLGFCHSTHSNACHATARSFSKPEDVSLEKSSWSKYQSDQNLNHKNSDRRVQFSLNNTNSHSSASSKTSSHFEESPCSKYQSLNGDDNSSFGQRRPLYRSKSFVEKGSRHITNGRIANEKHAPYSREHPCDMPVQNPLKRYSQDCTSEHSKMSNRFEKDYPRRSYCDENYFSDSRCAKRNSSEASFPKDIARNDSGCYEMTPDKLVDSCACQVRIISDEEIITPPSSSEALTAHFPVTKCSWMSQSIPSLETTQSFFLDSVDSTSEADCVIPPPVPKSNDTELDAKQSSSFSNASTINESLEEFYTNSSETSSVQELDSKLLESISQYLENIVKEKSVPCSPSVRVLRHLNALFKDQLEGNIIDIYGSYDSDLAISTSDINLFLKTETVIRKGFMYEVYKVLSSEKERYNVLPYEEGTTAIQTKIQFSDPVSGISCQLAYLYTRDSQYKQMGKLLRSVCLHDKRIKTLIIAVKIWADICLINEVDEGKLHPIGYIMMVLHFLQHYEKPLLPIPIDFYENLKVESSLPTTDSSVGELWMEFLKYYIWTFNWTQNVVTITSRDPVSKKSKGWENVWMAVEDPYTGKNIARTVKNSDVAESIKACFRETYEYFCNPLKGVNCFNFAEQDPQNGEDFTPGQHHFSFQHCVVDMSAHYCEACDELLDDICEDCQKKNYVAPMASVPAMTDEFLQKIKTVLHSVYEKYMLTPEEVIERKRFVDRLQSIVRRIYHDAELHLYGSSANGFGFKHSDLDICITFTDPDQFRNTQAVLKSLRYYLQRDKDFEHVIAIFSAQIPILKFHYVPKGWRGDICINNTLAVHNSRLLQAYSQLDERCRILGCALKLLAKKALIAGVTETALSSYSYLIMVIHFLQQTNPPVLPVLQDFELHKNEMKVNDIVDGWNVWYYKGKDIPPTLNNTPVEQLWLDLLDYYCAFNDRQYVTIRQREPVFLKEKQPTANLFNIQDPFIVVKNLGRVMSAKKAKETESVFRRARYLFRNPIKEFPSSTEDLENYFFSTMSLTGRIHKEVHCDMCGQFGHEQRDCKHVNLNRRFPFRRFKPKPMYQKEIPYRWQSAEKLRN